jgi:hypothetical protein
LDQIEISEKFTAPNPKAIDLDNTQRISIALLGASFLYLISYLFLDFKIYGPWPAVLGFIASVATIIWRTARANDDFDDGASL